MLLATVVVELPDVYELTTGGIASGGTVSPPPSNGGAECEKLVVGCGSCGTRAEAGAAAVGCALVGDDARDVACEPPREALRECVRRDEGGVER